MMQKVEDNKGGIFKQWADGIGRKHGIEGNNDYGPKGQHDDLDAFRHAFSHAMASTYSAMGSYLVGYILEIPFLGGWSATKCARAMDLHNNEVGRKYALPPSQVIRTGLMNYKRIGELIAPYVASAVKREETINSLDDPRMPQSCQDQYPSKKQQSKTGRYIWRTQGDKDVRSTHANREGQIFSWDNPPPGGHPGEDYGCRCTAETIKEDAEATTPVALLYER